MSRLDRHISMVRGKLLLGRFLYGLVWSLLALAAVVWTAIMIGRLIQLHLPRPELWLLIGVGAAGVSGWAFMLWRWPTDKQAAVAIDERLALKEKFSTALFARQLSDPFALAAVRDAEQTADGVSLQKRFPVEIPRRPAAGLAGAVAVILLTIWCVPDCDFFGVHAAQQKKIEIAKSEHLQAEKAVKQALAELQAAPKAISDTESIKLARQDLTAMLKRPMDDPVGAQRKAQSALQEMESVRQKIKDQEQFAEAQNEMKALQSMAPSADDKSPISQAQNAIIKGNFSDAVDDLKSAVDNFDKKTPQEQQQTAQAMAKLAQQVAQQANDPKVQQQIQQQLQKMGASQQQAQQMAQQMAAAANGDKAAQQQVQQAAKQLAQQMNQKQGGGSQQQQQMAQQMQQAMQQMQQQANSQAQAQQMAQAAQQLAGAMQQASQQGQGQQGQGQKGQGSQQAQHQQQMAQAGQSMQQQLQQLQAMANAAQGAGADQGDQNGGSNQNAHLPGGAQGGQWAQGNNQNQGQGFGGPGQAAGGRPAPEEAPFGVKQELSESQTNEKGKILASSFVKAGTIKGESKVGLSDAVLQEQQDAADEVDEDRIPRAASEAVKNYFQTLKDDSK
jgi:hypothetical protein